MRNLLSVIGLIIVFCLFCSSAQAAKSAVKGDPELLWNSPLGKEDIENTPYNRCLLIKKLRRGTSAEELNRDIYEILSEYTANLYAQSVKITAYIEEESKKEKTIKPGKLNDEISIIKKLILKRQGDIARRINIINSFEAGTSMLESLTAMVVQDKKVYATIECCSFLTTSECQTEKECKVEKGNCISAEKE